MYVSGNRSIERQPRSELRHYNITRIIPMLLHFSYRLPQGRAPGCTDCQAPSPHLSVSLYVSMSRPALFLVCKIRFTFSRCAMLFSRRPVISDLPTVCFWDCRNYPLFLLQGHGNLLVD
ncbi:hypothetical protein RRG08_020566 [Elysia crispata]|uniref:Uncharacterized protein n=1 Tax=Elysia crispata TaxID=231223 RepID=A0AAE1DT13_9GAST|nr:hypothetical protein RRG08_020566 [Elysia crispata]